MSSSTGWAGFAFPFRLRRIEGNEKGFFLTEILVLSFLVLACAASVLAYRVLAEGRRSVEAELTAYYLAREQTARMEAAAASYPQSRTEVAWLGKGESPVERNGVIFEVESLIAPHPEAGDMAAVEVRVRWESGGRRRETVCRKLVPYHE